MSESVAIIIASLISAFAVIIAAVITTRRVSTPQKNNLEQEEVNHLPNPDTPQSAKAPKKSSQWYERHPLAWFFLFTGLTWLFWLGISFLVKLMN